MLHKPYIYLILLSFVIWVVNGLIIRSNNKRNEKSYFEMDSSLSIVAMVYWAPLSLCLGLMGLIFHW